MDKELFNLMNRFKKDNYLIVQDGLLAKKFVLKPQIKQLRKNNNLFIGYDRNKKVTIIFKKPKL